MYRSSIPLRLSASAVRSFKECAYRYARDYIQRIGPNTASRSSALVLGEVVHAVIADFHRHGGWSAVGQDDLETLLIAHWRGVSLPDSVASFERARTLLQHFYDSRFPAVVTQELGVERWLRWERARSGIVASGRIDRACQTADGTLWLLDYKTGKRREGAEPGEDDLQTLFYRSLGAEAFSSLRPRRMVVAFVFLDGGSPVEVEVGRESFDDGWKHIKSIGAAIQAAKDLVGAGAPLDVAFPPTRCGRCFSCPLNVHCHDVFGPIQPVKGGVA